MIFELSGGIGDEVCVSGLVREYKKRFPEEDISVVLKRFPELLRNNPYITNNFSGERLILETQKFESQGNIVNSYCLQAKIPCNNNLPELYISDIAVPTVPSGTIAIDTRAGWPSRLWDQSKWNDLVLELIQDYYVIELGKFIADCFGTVKKDRLRNVDDSFVNKLSILETAAVLQQCDLFIGNDSGLYHIAASVDTPQIVLFSNKNPESRAYPNTKYIKKAKCSLRCREKCVNSTFCMDEIIVNDVLDLI
jgi:ADP-heptose:LPS heptosyltransferase